MLGLVAAAGTGAGLGLLEYLRPRPGRSTRNAVVVPAGMIPPPGGSPVYVADGRFWLVTLAAGERAPTDFWAERVPPAPRRGLLALSERCTHLGCKLPWRANAEFEGVRGWFKCPCHCSTFSRSGIRMYGPAPHAMDTLRALRNRDGSLTVYPAEMRRGDLDNPLRVLPL